MTWFTAGTPWLANTNPGLLRSGWKHPAELCVDLFVFSGFLKCPSSWTFRNKGASRDPLWLHTQADVTLRGHLNVHTDPNELDSPTESGWTPPAGVNTHIHINGSLQTRLQTCSFQSPSVCLSETELGSFAQRSGKPRTQSFQTGHAGQRDWATATSPALSKGSRAAGSGLLMISAVSQVMWLFQIREREPPTPTTVS